MCRYGTNSYKPHYACFSCRKTFKRRFVVDVDRDTAYTTQPNSTPAKCPECSELMADMGLDFESPKKNDVKAWAHVQNLYTVGITFHSCGCSGPGYIPRDKDELIAFLQSKIDCFNKELAFWRNREEPSTQSELDRENSTQWHHISRIPSSIRSNHKHPVSNEEAISFWIQRIKEVENNLGHTLN